MAILKKKDSVGVAVVRERIQSEILKKRQKSEQSWKYSFGPLFRFALVLYWISTVCALFIAVASDMLVYFALTAKLATGKAQEITFYKTEAAIVVVITLLLIVSVVLMKLKKRYAGCIVAFMLAAVLVFQIVEVIFGYYVTKSTLIVAYSVCLLTFVAALVMFLILRAERKEENLSLQKELGKIYAHFTSKEGILIAENEWDEYILKYEKEREEYLAKKSM